MENLFAYGSLMCEDIMCEVSGIKVESLDGVLKGFERFRVKGEDYPAIIQQENSAVYGKVYMDIPMRSWEKLDYFEGDMYYRLAVDIKLSSGEIIQADAYVIQPDFHNQLEENLWDFEEFLSEGKQRFYNQYKGFM